ncbi:AAA family ATPase, partial [candidate division KSB1 bacterium]|nr:AAA family ATPase [candidate division KSB1 bacterium]
MIIKHLTLQNYRRFRNLELEFPENLIGIIGSNGIGKTTIVEAIGWVLYGNRIKRTDKQDIRSQFSTNSDPCRVEMIFTIGGHEYRIMRLLKGKSALVEAAIYREGNPEPEAVQERGVNEFIEKLLNLDYRSFFVSVFARQKELAALSYLQPEERRKSIARLINIDAIERARKQIRADKNTKEAEVRGMRTNIKDEDELKTKKRTIKEQISAKQEVEKEHQKQVKISQEKLTQDKENLDALSKVRDHYLHLKSQLEKWEQRQSDYGKRKQGYLDQIANITKAKVELEKLNKQLENYDSVQQQKEQLDQNKAAAAELKGKLSEQNKVKQLLARQTEQLQSDSQVIQRLAPSKNQVEVIEKELAQHENDLEKLRKELTSFQANKQKTSDLGKEVKQRQERVDKLGKESPCPVCTRPLKEHYNTVLNHFDEELQKLRVEWKTNDANEKECNQKVQQLNSTIQTLKKSRDEHIRKQEQFNEKENAIKKIESDIKEWQLQLESLHAEIEAIGEVEYDEQKHAQLIQEYKKLSQLRDQALQYAERVNRLPEVEKELQETEKMLGDLANDIKEQSQQLEQLNYDERKYKQARQEVDAAQEELDKSRKQADQIQREIIILQKDLENVEAELKKQKELLVAIEKLNQELHYLSALDQHLGIFRQDLAGRIRPIIAQRASELMNLTTSGRYSLLELDDDYNIFLYDHTDRFPLARFSGGEQDLANLCIRIAVSQVVAERAGGTQINFIVLDEIFGSQDEERKELIMNTLQHLSSQFRQIFVITHVEEIKDIMPVVVSV